jgi:hypothetical protein
MIRATPASDAGIALAASGPVKAHEPDAGRGSRKLSADCTWRFDHRLSGSKKRETVFVIQIRRRVNHET